MESITGYYGTDATVPENPTKDGNDFSGWQPAFPSTFPAEDVTYKAVWSVLFYGNASSSADYIKNLKEDSTVCVTGELTGDLLKEIANAIKSSGYKVTLDLSGTTGLSEIPDNVFLSCKNLAGITIPEGVTSIGGSAFENCTSLASVTLPDTLQSLGSQAFKYCTSLANITLPDSLTNIDRFVFEHCTSLASIAIPDSVATIENRAFYYCSSLESITIPSKVRVIEYQTFYNCTSLTSVIVHSSEISIADDAFEGCTSFKDVTLIQEGIGLIKANAPTYSDVENLLTVDTSDSEKITFTAADGYSSYAWYIDDELQRKTDKTFTMNISDYSSGYYTVMLIADKYSATIQVTVSK